MIKKTFPIKKPYLYDTKEGIDYITKLSIEDNPKKLTPKELADIHKLGRDMKKSALEDHIKTLKPFDGHDPSTYPSRPEVRGKLLEIDKLEKDLAPPKLTNLPIVKNNINNKPRSRTGNPSGRDYWREFVKMNTGNKGERKLPVVSPEDRNKPRLWEDVIYPSMTIHEKGQWNAEKRKKGEDGRTGEKLPIKKVEKKPDDFVLDLEQSVPLPKPTVIPRTPIYPQKPIVNEVKEAPGISEDFVRLQTAIRKNIDYVLGTDQKDRKNTGEDK